MKEILNTADEMLEKLNEGILAWGMILLAGVTVGNAISRRFLGRSWPFGEEVSLFILVIVTFMGISYGTRRGRHIRMTALFDQASDETKRYLLILINLVTCIILLALAYYSFHFTIDMRAGGRVTPVLMVPYYLVVMWAPIGLFIGALQYFLAFLKNIQEDEPWISKDSKTEYRDPEDIKKGGL